MVRHGIDILIKYIKFEPNFITGRDIVGRAILKLPSVERLLIGFWNRPLLAIARSQKFIWCNICDNCAPKFLLLGL